MLPDDEPPWGYEMATKTAYDLLLEAPDGQITRCRLAWKSIASGEWADAAHYLRNAAAEEGKTEWAAEARALADICMRRLNRDHRVAQQQMAARLPGASRV